MEGNGCEEDFITVSVKQNKKTMTKDLIGITSPLEQNVLWPLRPMEADRTGGRGGKEAGSWFYEIKENIASLSIFASCTDSESAAICSSFPIMSC